MSTESRKKRLRTRSSEQIDTLQEERAVAGAKLTEVERAHARLGRLYEISKLLTRFDHIEGSAPGVLALVTDVVPLRSATLILEERGERSRTREIVWHADGDGAAGIHAARARARIAYAYLVRTGSPIDEESGEWPRESSVPPPAPEGEHGPFVVLPLVVNHSPIFGALQVEGAAALDEADLMFVNAVVNQLAVALDRLAAIEARQAEAEAKWAVAERARMEAERTAQSERFLSETSALLASSLDYRWTLGAVVRAAVPLLADVCFIDEVAEDGSVRRVEVVMSDAPKQHLESPLRQLAPGPDWQTPQAQVIRSGTPILLADLPPLETIAHDRAHAELLRAAGVVSMMVVPVTARGGTLGALTFMAATPGRRYSQHDLVLAEETGRRAGLAIDNARLYELAQRAIHAREDLLAIVSHDLKNPLGTIAMTTSVLLQSPDRRGRERDAMERIERSAARMNRLLSDLLDIASLESGHLDVEKEGHPAASLVQEAIELNQELAARKGLTLRGDCDAELTVDCDRDRLLQVFGNVIGNAIKFTAEGGTIAVRGGPHGAEVLFSVADSGPGIPPEELPHLFDRYWQAKKTARLGTGLGLTITKGIVEAHGGRIWVESTPGRGTTFSFTIPAAG